MGLSDEGAPVLDLFHGDHQGLSDRLQAQSFLPSHPDKFQ
jgi:hypothetical protein